MIDTLKLKSPPISEEMACQIERQLQTRSNVDNTTGEVLYEFTSRSLKGSFESSVSVNVAREDFVYFPPTISNPSARGVTEKVACAPFLVIEGSVHKAMLGHNVFGGPVSVVGATSWFLDDTSARLECVFPHWSKWVVLRLDWAEAYSLVSFEAVAQYLHGLGIARYPRRNLVNYDGETVQFAGTTTTTKFYHKGPEFSKNGRAKLERTTNRAYASDVQEKANNLLRVEVTIKSKKLKAQHGEHPHPQDISLDWIRDLYDVEVGRVLKEGHVDMKRIRTTDEVERRLYEVYGPKLAAILFGTWLRLAAQGETAVRSKLPRPTYYRHRKKLADAGCACEGTDVYLREDSLIPANFRPVRSDSRRLTDESPLVKEALFGHPVAV